MSAGTNNIIGISAIILVVAYTQMSYMLLARSRTKTGFSDWNTMTVGKKFRNIYMTQRKYIAPTMEWNSFAFADLQHS